MLLSMIKLYYISMIKVKKHRNENNWIDNKRKRFKAMGHEFVNKNGKLIPSRKTGTDCRYIL
jgi:hypothetical protein